MDQRKVRGLLALAGRDQRDVASDRRMSDRVTRQTAVPVSSLTSAQRRLVLALLAAQRAADMHTTGPAIVTPGPVEPHEARSYDHAATS
jgi:hypothetical protein